MITLNWVIDAFYHYIAAYVANATPVVIHGGGAIDSGMKWIDGKPLLGSHKTVIGTASGIIAGTLIGLIQRNGFNGFLLSVGAIGGDILTSFIKRRFELKPGASLPVGDQLGFIIFAALLGYLTPPDPSFTQTIFVILATLPIHYIVNVLAYLTNMKRTPW
jgi:CDP-2,3-bis-(O-geranylgeranyl)-sn-glycerol synthase